MSTSKESRERDSLRALVRLSGKTVGILGFHKKNWPLGLAWIGLTSVELSVGYEILRQKIFGASLGRLRLCLVRFLPPLKRFFTQHSETWSTRGNKLSKGKFKDRSGLTYDVVQ